MQLLKQPVINQEVSSTEVRKKSNDLIYFCQVGNNEKLECRWIKGCLI